MGEASVVALAFAVVVALLVIDRLSNRRL